MFYSLALGAKKGKKKEGRGEVKEGISLFLFMRRTPRPWAPDIWVSSPQESTNSFFRSVEVVQQTTHIGVEGLCLWERKGLELGMEQKVSRKEQNFGAGPWQPGGPCEHLRTEHQVWDLGSPGLRPWEPRTGSEAKPVTEECKPPSRDLLSQGQPGAKWRKARPVGPASDGRGHWMASRRNFFSSQDSLRPWWTGLLHRSYDPQTLTFGGTTSHCINILKRTHVPHKIKFLWPKIIFQFL